MVKIKVILEKPTVPPVVLFHHRLPLRTSLSETLHVHVVVSLISQHSCLYLSQTPRH